MTADMDRSRSRRVLTTIALSAAILLLAIGIGLTIGAACADCAVAWGWPLPLIRTAGYARERVWYPVGVIVDGLVAIVFSVASAVLVTAIAGRYRGQGTE